MTAVFSVMFWKKDCPNGPNVIRDEECDSRMVLSFVILSCVCGI